MKYFLKPILVILTAFIFTGQSSAETERKIITYTVTHPMKTVAGVCANPQVQGLALTKANNVISASAFQVVVPIIGMSSGNRNRDSTMQTILGYPAVSEWVAEIETVSLTGSSGVLRGVLRLGAKSAPLLSEFQTSEQNGELVVRGSMTVRLSDFQIEKPRLLLLAVDDEVKITYEFSVKAP